MLFDGTHEWECQKGLWLGKLQLWGALGKDRTSKCWAAAEEEAVENSFVLLSFSLSKSEFAHVIRLLDQDPLKGKKNQTKTNPSTIRS